MEIVEVPTERHISIGLEDPDVIQLVTCIREELQCSSPLSSECCIYRVPKQLRETNKKAYTPQIVSIGPLHHDKEGLEAMEVHKRRYLQDFLQQTNSMNLEDFVKFIKEREARIRNCYAETIEFNSDKFVKMILVDAAFTIEVLLKSYFPKLVDANDRMLDKPHMKLAIYADMLLLENQLPFFIIEDLFGAVKTTVASEPDNWPSIIELTHAYFKSPKQNDNNIPEKIFTSEIKHFIDFNRILVLPSKIELSPKGLSKFELKHNLTELQEAGVKFKVASSTNLLDIIFTDNGILEIPSVVITQNSEYFLRNLIAFEQCHYGDGLVISDYIVLMDSLVNSAKDVKLLIRAKILENWLGDDLEVSTFYNSLAKGVPFNSNTFYFTTLCEDIKIYCKVPWHKWKAALKQHYFEYCFKYPWAVISAMAGGVILVLTIIQYVITFA